jgi:hypothetical protein
MPRLRDKRYMWAFSMEKIWFGQFLPVLQEAAQLANTVPIGDDGQTAISFETEPDAEFENYTIPIERMGGA